MFIINFLFFFPLALLFSFFGVAGRAVWFPFIAVLWPMALRPWWTVLVCLIYGAVIACFVPVQINLPFAWWGFYSFVVVLLSIGHMVEAEQEKREKPQEDIDPFDDDYPVEVDERQILAPAPKTANDLWQEEMERRGWRVPVAQDDGPLSL